MVTYCYVPLSHEKSEIRLLSIEAGPWEAEIQCHLYHVSLDENPHYDALSYTWGDLTDSRSISLGNGPWNVTANLHDALQHMRSADQAKMMWIDALCIDQTDLEERSVQIPRMQHIYDAATQVIAWLGLPSSPDDYAAIDDIKDIATKWEMDTTTTTSVVGISHQDLLQMDINTSNYNWNAIWALLDKPYWTRVWVIQELASCGILSDKKGIIACGSKSISKKMCDAICMLFIIVKRSPNFWDNEGNLVEPLRTLFYKGVPGALFMFIMILFIDDEEDDSSIKSLSSLLRAAGNFRATDLRDKIYALIGLARKQDHLLAPDYSKPAEQVVESWARELLRHDSCLSILLYNRRGTNGFGPSWIPDLFEVQADGPAWADEGRRYQVATCLETEVDFDESNHAVHVRGFKIGVCEVVIGPLEQSKPVHRPDQHPMSDYGQLAYTTGGQPFFERLREFIATLSESEHETCWRTLVMDVDLSDFDEPLYPAPAQFETYYRSNFIDGGIPDDFKPDLPEEIRHLEYERSSTFTSNMLESISTRCFFKTTCGKMGLGPYCLKNGDIVAALFGASLFAVLRPRGDNTYELMGDAYVHGGMGGEFVTDCLKENTASHKFIIT